MHQNRPSVKKDYELECNPAKPLPPTPTTSTASDSKIPEGESETPAPWRSLFAFTTRAQLLPLSAAIIFAIAAGAVSPIMNVFLGNVLDSFTKFGSGNVEPAEFRHKVSRDCIYLAGLGVLTWILDGIFFVLWLYFGELQARACRLTIFDGLLEKPIAWYDTQSSGISALTPKIQA